MRLTEEVATFLYPLTIFGSAFLLFLLQVITAKQILPWFGGSAAVWAACLVFFQAVLLLGYVYSDWSARRLVPRHQVLVHVTLLGLSLAVLPVVPDGAWKPTGSENPVWHILGLLTVSIGLPFFLLSTTNPLLQAWFARRYSAHSPYRLFALSNLASMLALLGYPLMIEPWSTVSAQAYAWSFLYATFVAFCGSAAWLHLRERPVVEKSISHSSGPPTDDLMEEQPPTWRAYLLWTTFAALGSFLLVAVSNYLAQDIAAVPLLWVLPLSVYLLSFALCFDRRKWYRPDLFLALLALALCAMASDQLIDRGFHAFRLGVIYQIGLFLVGLFIVSMFCHGELNAIRPAPRYLTSFYLMIAFGGACGALLAGVVAPLVFSDTYEMAFGIVAVSALALYRARRRSFVILCVGMAVLLYTAGATFFAFGIFKGDQYLTTRNFYGVLRVRETPYEANPEFLRRELVHGRITHGDQILDRRFHRALGTYYRTTSGIGRTLIALGRHNLRVGIIGLGVGTIAAYGRPGDVYRFYELNPAILEIASREFTYLKDSWAKIEVALGDARLHLEREPGQRFDVLAVDAFSGDAIPVHLITNEALSVYLRHLRNGGVIAFHVTNRYLDLVPVVQRLAAANGLTAAHIADRTPGGGGFDSDWVLVSSEKKFFDSPEIKAAALPIDARPDWRVWTDDYSNLFQVLR